MSAPLQPSVLLCYDGSWGGSSFTAQHSHVAANDATEGTLRSACGSSKLCVSLSGNITITKWTGGGWGGGGEKKLARFFQMSKAVMRLSWLCFYGIKIRVNVCVRLSSGGQKENSSIM